MQPKRRSLNSTISGIRPRNKRPPGDPKPWTDTSRGVPHAPMELWFRHRSLQAIRTPLFVREGASHSPEHHCVSEGSLTPATVKVTFFFFPLLCGGTCGRCWLDPTSAMGFRFRMVPVHTKGWSRFLRPSWRCTRWKAASSVRWDGESSHHGGTRLLVVDRK